MFDLTATRLFIKDLLRKGGATKAQKAHMIKTTLFKPFTKDTKEKVLKLSHEVVVLNF
ncbi:hypothetical protein RirG_017420 [Rhizophagus irregularis DAOM 197198w]|uniref:Uncharacterized protein n=1 Tax=Rhizophagus irregularis (strain DAOM 197198w) TaxID=1432141 RepID=A0A015NFN7_RHIIW|nr:hypothetical protein RirG_017420 [Rhizophagus irregularis DAOM 197198w]